MEDTTTTMRAVLARLTAAEGELAALRRAHARRPAWRRGSAALAVAVLVALVPLSLLAANPFNDLAGGVHDPNIDLIYNAGITTGCVPDVSYCPNATVTRQEMASFLARTAGLGGNKPVARAARLAVANPSGGSPSYAANELTRLAFVNTTSSAPLTVAQSGLTPIVGVPLNVPVQAYVRVSFTAQASASSAVGCPCSLRLYLQQDAQAPVAVKRINLATSASDIVAGFERRDLSGSFVFLASVGDHAYTLRAEQVGSSSADLAIIFPNLQAEIFPFGGGGAGAAGASDAPQDAPQD